ncbi:MAG: di-trans,poly-cis-decaprenylcistransferase [Pseudomonadota bacterium]
MQRTLQNTQLTRENLHVAIIMDGNGRWATKRGLPRQAGHQAGVSALRDVVEASPKLGITMLTVYAFSVDNWKRPKAEISAIFTLLKRYLERELASLVKANIKLTTIGRRDRIPGEIATALQHAEKITANGTQLHLRVALDYSSRDSILAAAAACHKIMPNRAIFAHKLAGSEAPRDVDLLIRTSGEKRLSDFLLWEAAYAELYFTDQLWPDFGEADLSAAVEEYHRRDRRYGTVQDAASTAA